MQFKILLYRNKTTQNFSCTRKKFRFEVLKVKLIFDIEKTVGYEIVQHSLPLFKVDEKLQ